MTGTNEEKAALRKASARRRQDAYEAMPDAGVRLCDAVVADAPALGLDDPGRVVSVFWSMGNEIDTAPLLTELSYWGHDTALPVVAKKHAPLVFRRWRPGDDLVPGGFGTSVPSPDAPEVVPDFLFVPLLAWDNTGYRLGYGGGFYDRTLEKLRAKGNPIAVGVAFSAQRVDTVPHGPHDQRLDWIVTENGARQFPIDDSK